MLNKVKRKNLLIHASEAGIATVISCLDFDLISKRFNIFYDLHGVAKRYLSNNNDLDLKSTGEVPNISIFGYDKSSIDITSDFLDKLPVDTYKIGVLDTWKGLERFWYDNEELRVMPDKLLVPLPSIKEFLSKKGGNSEIIQIYRHPCLENIYLHDYINNKYNLPKTVIDSPYYLPNRKNLIILSEPLLVDGDFISLLDAKTENNTAIEDLIQSRFSLYNIFLRTHPIEFYSGNIDFIDITSTTTLEESLEFGDAFIGLGSTVISYASLTGKRVYSLDNDIEWWTPRHSQINDEIWDELKNLGLTETNTKKSTVNPLINFPSIDEYI